MSATDIVMIEDSAPVPFGFCHCRCGGRTSIAKKTYRSKGWVKGEPIRFISGHNSQPSEMSSAVKAARLS